MADFAHLHVHSEFSLLDGLSKISQLISKTKENGQTHLALTDHGAMYGIIDFYKKATKEGIVPILGCEIYIAENSRFDRKRQDAYHLLLLAENFEGYQNLMQLVTIAQTEGFYYKPRIDKEVLSKYHSGLIASTACPASRSNRLIISEGYEAAKREIQVLEQIMGSSNVYLEIQRHHLDTYSANEAVPDSVRQELRQMHLDHQKIESNLIKLSQDLGLPIIATNDIHYVNKDDAAAQDAIVCVQTGKFISDVHRMRYVDTPDFYCKSTEEMKQDFSDLPEAITNTQKLADRCQVSINLGSWNFPQVTVPAGKSAGEALKEMAFAGAVDRFGTITAEIEDRLNYELGVIDQKGYSPYFLLYHDLVSYANQTGIYINTRGSAAGSLVSYCCDITTVDPLKFNLPFERFLNPFRPSPPDIDLDVSDARRDDLINYLKTKYGSDKVAQICTFGTMKARAAVRDIGRVLGMPYSEPDKLSKMIPEGSQGFPMTIKKAMETTPELKAIVDGNEQYQHLFDLARKVEGNARHISVHAAAVVVGPDSLVKFTPLQLEPAGGDKIITQYEMHASEDVGLIKLDILGIRNLTILAEAVELVKLLRHVDIDIKKIPLDDAATFKILQDGETFGVFQLAGSGMTKYLVDLSPERIDDLMAMVALYRPGPISFIPEYIERKRHPEKVVYFDPRMESYLSKSYGIITYQDDVLYTALNLAGYNWEEADKFRKAIGKKIPEEMEKQHTRFVDGCVSNGMTHERAEELFKQIETFAAYGFNKAHAASYGMVAYWTAYVKAHYPVEYMTSLMTAEASYTDKLIEAIIECEKLGIKVLPPDINESKTNFTIVDLPENEWLATGRARTAGKAIRFGLAAIKNVGEAAISAITSSREEQPFSSFTDFISRVDLQKVNKKVIESLIKVGALDRYGRRSALLQALPSLRDSIAKRQKSRSNGQTGLFDSVNETTSLPTKDSLPDVPEFPLLEKLKYEKELLGIYLTDNPVRNLIKPVVDKISHKINQIEADTMTGRTVTLAGILQSVRLVNTKKDNHKMAFVSLEDDTGKIDLTVFPKLYAADSSLWTADNPIIVTGKVDYRDERLSVVVDSAAIIGAKDTYEINIPRGTPKEQLLAIRQLLEASPGTDKIIIVVPNGAEGPKRVTLPFSVNYDQEIQTKVQKIIRVA